MDYEKIETLLEWGKSHGAYIPEGLGFEFDHLEGIRCICNKALDNPKIEIPKEIIISRKLIPLVFPALTGDECDSNTWLTFLLAKLMFDDDHSTEGLREKFRPYLDCLPKVVDSPLIWNPVELDCLHGTNLGNSLRDKLRVVFKEWYEVVNDRDHFNIHKIVDELSLYKHFDEVSYERIYTELLTNTIQRTPSVWYSFSAFLWAKMIFLSRAFPEYVLDNGCEETSVILLPIIDLLNHDYNSKVEWFSETDNFCYQRRGSLSEGEQLYNNYGGKGNEELLFGYGFVLKENLFNSVALKIKVPLVKITDLIEEEPRIKLPTIDDYTTFAFERKTPENEIKDNKSSIDIYKDGVTFFINKMNRSSLLDLLNLFAYLCKDSDEKWDELTPLFKGLQSLRGALERKLQEASRKTTAVNYGTAYEVNSYRLRCADVYRADQVSILKFAISQLKSLEKEWMTKNKLRLLTMKKVLKYDADFITEELPLFLNKKNQEDIVFNTTFDFLVLWILVKLKNSSFPPKYSWVQEQFNAFREKTNMRPASSIDADISLFFDILISNSGAESMINQEDVKEAYEFASVNSFTRFASTSQETVLVKRQT